MLKVCLTGATGFIGKNLLNILAEKSDIEVIALSRKVSPLMDGAKKGNVTWRRCNGFSLIDVEKATEDVDVLIYLIHSMLPSTALSQGNFTDFDLYLADNFARAASKNKVKKIIYLSGIIPPDKNLSNHLLSRLEVESALSQFNNDLTVLRAGLIVGPNGSSFTILEKLVKRLPALICPAWTLTKSQPIDLKDVLSSLNYCIENHESLNDLYDIGGPDILTYMDMLKKTAEVLNKKRLIVNVPFFSPGLSKLWVSRITSTPSNLVYPLVESLKHEMVVNKDQQLIVENHKYTNFMESLKRGVCLEPESWGRIIINYNANINFRWMENVTSIQRIEKVDFVSAEEISALYFNWLPKLLKPLITVTQEKDLVFFKLFNKYNLLVLQKSDKRTSTTRVVYYILGGLLARETTLNGRLEFRWIESSQSVLIGLLDYRPALPWFIYKYTQAILHSIVMRRFNSHVKRIKK